MNRPVPPRSALIVAFAIVYVVWGSTYLAMRIAVESLPPFALAGVRFSLAGLLLLAWSARRGQLPMTLVHWREALLTGALLLLGGNGAVVWSVQFVPSGLAALMVATLPVWIVVLQWLLDRRRPPTLVLLGLGGGLVGIAALLGPTLLSQLSDQAAIPPGPALVLLAASLCWAAGSLRSRKMPPPPGSPFLVIGMQMVCGGLLLLGLALVTGEFTRIDPATFTARSLAALAYLVFFGSLLGYTAFAWLVHAAPPAQVATYAYVNPVIAVFLGWALGNEPLTARIVVSAAIILGSVAVITQGTQSTQSAQKQPDGAADPSRDRPPPAAAQPGDEI